MDEKSKNQVNKSAQALALQIGTTATAWIIIPALLAVYGGQWLDRKFDSEPILFVIAMALAFVVTLVGIIKMAKEYLKQEAKNSKE